MTFNSVWLSVLTMLPPARRLAAWLAASFLLLNGGAALAANNFKGGAVTDCSLDAASKVYSCGALSLPDFNTATTIASGYTVVVSSPVILGYNHSLQMSGSARLQSSGDINLAGVNGPFLNISGGTLATANGEVKLGDQTQTITVNINAKSVSVGSSATRITGTVTATGAITTGSNVTITGAVTSSGGAISLGSDTAINGVVSAASISTGSNVKLSATLSVGGVINLGSGNTIGGTVDGASITTGSGVSMGALTVTGAADLGSANTINGNLAASSLKTDSSVTITGSVKTQGLADLGSAIKIGGGVDGGSVKTGSPGQINGGIASKSTVDLGSGLTITGNVGGTVITSLSPVNITGNVAASTSFTLPSGSTVNGNISGGELTIMDGGSTINGNVTMTGNVTIGSSGRINGDLVAYNVSTHASDAIVSGNAAVNAIYLDYGARVNKTITCTGAAPGAPVCSCVTRADSSYQPTCGAAAPVGPHHIQITHSGKALTCQAQPVTLTACADAACGSTYNGSTTVTLSPGGGAAFSFNGSITAAVRNPIATPTGNSGTPLSAVVNGISNANVCPNASTGTNNCNMVFSDNGLPISVPDHISMNAVALSVQALKSDPNGTCVPLVKNTSVQVNVSCKYQNPSSGAASVPILINNGTSDSSISCGNSGASVLLAFDQDGVVTPTPTLKYAEVGKVSITAAYTGSGGNTNLAASGSASFIAAPDRFVIEATRVGGPYASGNMPAVPLAASSEPFTLKISAVNKDGVTTKNFGKEDAPESFTVDEKLKFPTGGIDIATKGSFGAIVDGVGGSANDSTGLWMFAESGTVTLSAKLANESTYYMNTNPSAFKFNTKGTQDVRFVPNHLETVLVDGAPMSCAGVSSVANPCKPLNETGKLVYSKQGFALKVIAYNTAASTSVSKNYRDLVSGDALAVAKDITLTAWSTAGGTTAAAVANAALQTGVKFSFVEGTGQLASGSVLPMFEFKSGLPDATGAAAEPVTLFIRAADKDEVTSKRTSNPVEAPLTIVGGRMQVTNNYGSTSSPLPVEVQAQYYSATARAYVFNSQFSPASTAVGGNVNLDNNVVYTNCTGQLACGTLQVLAPKTLNFKNGKATFRLAPPSAAGSVNVAVVPATNPAWTDSLPSAIPYLPAPASGRATFGIYRSGPVIYTREVHN